MATCTLNRRDPQKGKRGFSTLKGFTAIELMIALAVVAIVASIAFPTFIEQNEKHQVVDGAEQLQTFLGEIRSLAVASDSDIHVSIERQDKANWCVGFSDAGSCSCSLPSETEGACAIEGQAQVFGPANLFHANVLEYVGGDGEFVYSPTRGLVYSDNSFSEYDRAEWLFVSEQQRYALRVTLNEVGRVQVCSLAEAGEITGYTTCKQGVILAGP